MKCYYFDLHVISQHTSKQEKSKMDDYEQRIRHLPELFDGNLTPEIIEMLKFKVTTLGVSKAYIAKFFGITPSTLHKWISGQTSRCGAYTRSKLIPFLKGEYDFYIKSHRKNDDDSFVINSLPDNMLLCMERISRIYDYCSKSEIMKQRFIEKMDTAAFSALIELIPDDAVKFSKFVSENDSKIESYINMKNEEAKGEDEETEKPQ